MNFKKVLIGALAGLALTASALAADVTGAGATFPYPIYAKWAASYKGVSGVGLNYQSIGSGGGIAQIKAKTVTFGATDAPLKPADLNKFGLAQFPTVIGGVVPVVNVPGIGAGQLVLNGKVLADIFMGNIATWNDPAIKALNPGLNLPSTPIAVVHRSDGSGTTFIFTTFLSRLSKDWADNAGAATAVDWPVGIGAKGNEGVAGNVAQTAGSIGYVEYAYAKVNHLKYARMINKNGKTVSPSADTFKAAAANADWNGAAGNGFYIILVDQPGDTAWPITATTYILVYKNPSDQAATANVLKFFKWSYANGDQAALSLDYVPLPDNAVQAIQNSWKQIQGSGM
ncbi:MAG TPA: phosphate ABC transporter substrate-binding protein PstS [Rhizomicrobium sp.]|jgi:phosphate transport system substrate-binding protein|nr:phosphate ABC transporter substrate-binding protein PstS [Rhizomicrobium sp.]